ncbi:MAG TPA: FCD domain-containing protein, partial [Chloroflexota bacterium]|nr:FCD domain-containing protein [Chloroflexota bacterium]
KPNDVREIYAVREALETLAVRILASDPQPDRLAPLQAIVARMRQAYNEGNVQRQFELDVEFHTALCAATGNRRLQDLFASLRPDVQRIFLFAVNAMTLEGPDAPEVALAEHEALLQAITDGDPALATSRLIAHTAERAPRIAGALGGN